MSESRRIADLMSRVIEGDPWHAANIMHELADVTAAEANARPMPGVHTIWELVLHLTGWATEVTARVNGRAAGTPASGDWPEVGAPTEARWTAARTGLAEAYAELNAVVAALPAAALTQPVLDRRSNAMGTGLSRYLTIHGAIHHGVYHAGQIAMLKKALRSDEAFVGAIEACTLPSAEFTHRNHVRLAWLYLRDADAATAGRKISDTILRYATSLGAARKFDADLTLRWMQTVERAMQQTPAADFDSFIDAHPELLRRDLLSSTR